MPVGCPMSTNTCSFYSAFRHPHVLLQDLFFFCFKSISCRWIGRNLTHSICVSFLSPYDCASNKTQFTMSLRCSSIKQLLATLYQNVSSDLCATASRQLRAVNQVRQQLATASSLDPSYAELMWPSYWICRFACDSRSLIDAPSLHSRLLISNSWTVVPCLIFYSGWLQHRTCLTAHYVSV